jgi:hypothetical protein
LCNLDTELILILGCIVVTSIIIIIIVIIIIIIIIGAATTSLSRIAQQHHLIQLLLPVLSQTHTFSERTTAFTFHYLVELI